MEIAPFDAGVPAFGTGVLYAFLVSAAAAFALAVLAGVDHRGAAPRLLRAARLAALGTCALIGLDVLLLLYGFLSHDFRIRYVAHYSDRSMPLPYLVSALWGGQDGSLLWWTFLLSVYTSACVVWLRGRHRELQPWVIATLMSVVMFFGVLMAFAANPFAASFGAPPADGEGLNPQLQNFYMAIHPPSLYIGFVGCAVPFAFAVAALVSGRLDEEWIVAARRWVLFAWMFLSIGNVLGMLWAYEELGWGGFWAWDPVENAACLPWWTLTAFMHSVMTQERRGILKVWNVALLIGTFFLTIFGTFLTRSGLISSVHSFAQSEIGIYFVYYMALLVLVGLGLVLWRLPRLRRPAQIDAVLSREAMFIANNWLLLGICVFIALATTWPKVSEWLWDERLTVGASFYNAWLTPVGLALFALMGVGTLTPWRKGTPKLLLEAFRGPLAAALGGLVAHLTLGRHLGFAPVIAIDPIYDVTTPLRLFGFTLGHINVGRALAWLNGHLAPVATALFAFNVAALGQEFFRGTRARMAAKAEAAPVALTRLVSRNRRRYGGYIVHLGFAIMMLGFAGSAFRSEAEATLRPGESFRLGRYTLRYDRPDMRRSPNRREVHAKMTVIVDGRERAQISPARFVYASRQEMPTTEVSITSGLREDLYVVMASLDAETRVGHFKAYVNPLTMWIWLGGMVMVMGVVLAMWPEASRAAAAALAARRGRRPAPATAVAALALLALALPRPAAAQEGHVVRNRAAPGEVERFSVNERRMYEGLRCMCGDCPRQPLSECTCDFAARQRQRMRARLAAGESASAIIAAYVEAYGRGALAVPPDEGYNKAIYIVPVAALAAGAGLVVHLARKWARRGASAAVGPAATTPAPRSTYDDRIDEELRGLDD